MILHQQNVPRPARWAILATLLIAASVHAEELRFSSQLDGSQEVPPVATSAKGRAKVVLDTETSDLCLSLSFERLSSAQSAAYIQGPATPGSSGGVLFSLPLGTFEAKCFKVDEAAISALRDGRAYLNVCTEAFPGGEIRGQIVPVTRRLILDVRPSTCLNPVDPRARGTISVALLGMRDLEVSSVDVSSLLLAGKVRPKEILRADVGAPGGVVSDCHCNRMRDGAVDLVMKFKTEAIVEALDLSSLPHGTLVSVELSGLLRDGTPFQATDCLRVVYRMNLPDSADGPDGVGLRGVRGNVEVSSAIGGENGLDVRFGLDRNAHVRLTVHDVSGRRVATLSERDFSPGEHVVSWRPSGAASGVYFLRLESEDWRETRKAVLVR